jgi:phosphoglycolate phosphatase-like HAD superfamily hydrolase
MSFKTLVLDIDGVLIRNTHLMSNVKNNCVSYVAKKLPKCKDPEEVNKVMYLAYGHTARGLQYTYGVDTNDFNRHVYNKQIMAQLYEEIYGTEFQQMAKEIHDLTNRGWNICLFTNAPYKWAKPVALAIGDEVMIKCAGNDITKCPLKPEATAYLGFPKTNLHIFCDDSLKNLGTVRWLRNWKPVYFGEKQKLDWLTCVDSMWELLLYVNSVDQWIDENHFKN